MNYENLIQRLIDGLGLIRSYLGGTAEIAAHGYVIIVPALDFDIFSDDDVGELNDWGWRWDTSLGWVFPTIG